jgi:serine phosphatase RsbU (regulator of sigma subunit)
MKHALLGTLPGRAIVIGAAVKLLIVVVGLGIGPLPLALTIVDTAAGLAMVAGGAYFVFRLFVLAKQRLLWRVRRKLILSYIFIGFVPALLLVAFFALGGLLLFFNFSSYLVQTEVRSFEDRARFLAASTAIEIQRASGRDAAETLNRRHAMVEQELGDVSMAVVPVTRTCDVAQIEGPGPALAPAPARVGGWTMAPPPAVLPDWIGCDDFVGVLPSTASRDGMLVRAVAFPDGRRPRYAVVVDVVVNEQVKERWRRDTGVAIGGASDLARLDGSAAAPAADAALSQRTTTPAGLIDWVTFLDYREWMTGARETLLVSTRLSITEMYGRIAAAQGIVGNRSFAQVLLLVLLVVIGGLFLIIVAVALIVGLALARSITGSVHELFLGTERVRQGDFTHKIAVTAADQLGELAKSFNSMTSSIADLLKQAAEKKRLEEELRIAHEIQMSLLPQGPLVMRGLSVTALCIPAREVGGDYYDFLPLDDQRVGVLIADVSGKGTSAALYMAELKGLMLSLSRIHDSPRELLINADRIIREHLDPGSFITMTYAVVDLGRMTMTYARAGHTPLLYVPGPRDDDRSARVLTPGGLVLGLKIDNGEIFERVLEEQVLALHAGDLYVFFTDGVTEAMNVNDDCFGEARLGRLLESDPDALSDDLRERVLTEVRAFAGGAPQHDDMTMILLKIVDEAGAPDRIDPAVAHQLA